MHSSVVNIKVEPKVKKEAKKIASDLGFSLSGFINACLKQMIRNKAVYFSLEEKNPSPFLLRVIKEAEKEKKKGRIKSFKNLDEAVNFLDEPR